MKLLKTAFESRDGASRDSKGKLAFRAGILAWIARLLPARRSARRGSVAIQTAMVMVVLIGMASLGTEIPSLMYQHRQMQTAADSAAQSAAVAMSKGYPAITTEAYGVTAALGFINGRNNVTITVNNPPQSGSYAGNSSAVEVIVNQPQTMKMARLFGISQYNLKARAVALNGVANNGSFCILSTDTGLGWGIGLWGSTALTMKGCGIAANAYGQQAIAVSLGAILNAPLASTVGRLFNFGGTVNVTQIKQNQAAITDPYANIAMPSSAGCDHNNFHTSSAASQTIYPGRYCSGLTVSKGTSVTFAPGIYYIKGGSLNITAGPKNITGSGVTFILTTIDGCSICFSTVQILEANDTVISLSAPTSGPVAGILFFGDRKVPLALSNFGVFGHMTLTGAVYLPTHLAVYAGTGAITGCHQLIARNFNNLLSSLTFDGTCLSGTGMQAIGATSTLLAE